MFFSNIMGNKLVYTEFPLEVLANDCSAFEINYLTKKGKGGQSQIQISNANPRNLQNYARIPALSLEGFKSDFTDAFFGLFTEYVAVGPASCDGRVVYNLIDKGVLRFPSRTSSGLDSFQREDHLYSGIIGQDPVMVQLGIVGRNSGDIIRFLSHIQIEKPDYTVGFDLAIFSGIGSEQKIIEKVQELLFPVIERYADAGSDKLVSKVSSRTTYIQ